MDKITLTLSKPYGIQGEEGKSAYEVWLSLGNTGTEQDFIDSIAADIQQGIDGKSAYEVWLDAGNTGTEQDFLNSLVGPEGPQGPQGPQGAVGPQGPEGPIGPQGEIGPAGADGADGESAYEVWLAQGNVGTEQDFFDSLASEVQAGVDGDSTYEIWLSNGNTGTEQDFLNSLTGPEGPIGPEGPQGPQGIQGIQGDQGPIGPQGPQGIQGEVGPIGPEGPVGPAGSDGSSAYEIWLSLGNTGTEQDFINSLKGEDGAGAKISAITPTNFSVTDNGDAQVTLTWTNPVDVYGDDGNTTNILIYDFDRVILLRDGVSVYEGTLETFTDIGLTNGNTYNYELYAVTVEGTASYSVFATGEPNITYKVYGVNVDKTNSNPETAVTYTNDSIGITPANGGNGNFSYGSWENEELLQGIRPCVFDPLIGEVVYYLDPNNFNFREDGVTAANISGSSADGEVMIEIPKIYWKVIDNGTNYTVLLSKGKVDSSFNAYAHKKGMSNEVDYIYFSAYMAERNLSESTLVSRSGTSVSNNIKFNDALIYAENSNMTLPTFSSLTLLRILFVMIFKNLDGKTALGKGNQNLTNGGTEDLGMFYGTQSGADKIKFLGIENFWGSNFYPINGVFIDSSGDIYYDLHNTGDLAFYELYGPSVLGNNDQGYVSNVTTDSDFCFFPTELIGSETEYYASNTLMRYSSGLFFGSPFASYDGVFSNYFLAKTAALTFTSARLFYY